MGESSGGLMQNNVDIAAKQKGGTARTAIKRAFIEIYKKKPYECITVKELCAAVPVARTTFYGIYQNTHEVRNEIEDEFLAGIMQLTGDLLDVESPQEDFEQFFMRTIAHIECHWDIVYALLVQ